MPSNEVNEQGRFWLAGTPIGEGRPFPTDAEDGTLTIDENGRITLHRRPITRNNPSKLKINKEHDVIIGYLPQSDRYVYITGFDFFHWLRPVQAKICLICHDLLPDLPKIDSEANIEIALDGFEYWLGLPFPRYECREDGTVALIGRPMQYHNFTKIGLNYDITIEKDWIGEVSRAKGVMAASGKILLKPHSATTLPELAKTIHMLEEFLLLLTDRHRSLAWPRIKRQKQDFVFYYLSKSKRGQSEIDHLACSICFPSITEKFCEIINNWYGQNDILTLACQFYLATRRLSNIPLELKFVSLVWALEAMSR
ncbi:MAG: hypothetical protein ACP5M5_14170, partial [Acidibrevibacterium sp.]|uniref:ApeA N-terminal domain 1-containing protein n=1 Tax=Acidibrevibacterium sp. TaxID=2606776 RepID=UPI003D041737